MALKGNKGSNDIAKTLMTYSKKTNYPDVALPNENWTPLQFACAIGDLSCAQYLIESKKVDFCKYSESKAVPMMSPIHICALHGHVDILLLLANSATVDVQDQWGFTPLHYAVYGRAISAVKCLLEFGADATICSKSGSSPLQIAQELRFHDIADVLASRVNIAEDPSAPQFREWLRCLGAGSYTSSFFGAGYDLAFIAKHGLSDEDLDCVGIPSTQMGLRRKLKALHKIDRFAPAADGADESVADSEEEESSGGESDGSEES